MEEMKSHKISGVDRRAFLGHGAIAAGVLRSGLLTKPLFGADSPVVETTAGKVRGSVQGKVNAFKGIPYGTAARFQAPAKVQPWTGVRDALSLGVQAPQNSAQALLPSFLDGLTEKSPTNSEDCLQLHVWTPALGRAEKRPVMVWLHGGGFGSGSPNWPLYDGANLAAKQGVVMVGIKHRLNAFGFLYLAELGGSKFADSGTAGMLDVVAALQWVRDNIANFGGDPANVTIFGESGGGAKVSTVMAMPAATGLFHKAIAQSTVSLKGMPRAGATKAAQDLLAKVGLKPTQLDELQKLPMQRLLDAMPTPAQYRFAPVMDGRGLPSNPFDPASLEISAGVPLLIGVNATEITGLVPGISTAPVDDAKLRADLKKDLKGEDAAVDRLIAAYKKARPKASNLDIYWAIASDNAMGADAHTATERKAAQGKGAVYAYELTWTMPVQGGKLGSPHLLDLPLVFGNVDIARGMLGSGPEPQALSDRMSAAWAAFARSGNPSHKGIPNWPAYKAPQRSTMIFDNECKLANDPLGQERAAMNAFRGVKG